MTKASPEAAASKRCIHCIKPFASKRSDAKTCSPACRKAAQRATQVKKDDKRLERFRSSAIGQYLAGQCKRAGTVAVLPRSLDSLTELYQIHAYAIRANNYGASQEYSICHISPVTQKAHIGSLYPQNLAVAPTKLNAGFGNKSFPGAGHRILKAKLSPAHRVEQDATKATVLDAIITFLTPALVCQWVVKCKIQCTQKAKLLTWLTTNELAIDDDRVPSLAELHDMTGKQLSDLQTLITGKKSGFAVQGYTYFPSDVFFTELRRLAKHYPATLGELLSAIQWIEYERGKGYWQGYDLPADILQAQFHVLHGGPVHELLLLAPARAVMQEYQPRDQSPAEFNAWLRDLQVTFPELAEGYEFMSENGTTERPASPAIADAQPESNVVSFPVVRGAFPLPWEQRKPRPTRPSFSDELDALDGPCTEDEEDDWSHLDVYLDEAV